MVIRFAKSTRGSLEQIICKGFPPIYTFPHYLPVRRNPGEGEHLRAVVFDMLLGLAKGLFNRVNSMTCI